MTDDRPAIDRDVLLNRDAFIAKLHSGDYPDAILSDTFALLDALDAETRRANAAEAEVVEARVFLNAARNAEAVTRAYNAELLDQAHRFRVSTDRATAERDSLGERIALAIEAESNATSGRAFETHDEFCEYREGMTTAARIAREFDNNNKENK